MDIRDQHVNLFDRLHEDEPDPSTAADPPLASERLRRDVDRITGKIDRIVKTRPVRNKRIADPIRIINLCLVILTLSTVVGFITWYRTQSEVRRVIAPVPKGSHAIIHDDSAFRPPENPLPGVSPAASLQKASAPRNVIIDRSTPASSVSAAPAPTSAPVRTSSAAPAAQQTRVARSTATVAPRQRSIPATTKQTTATSEAVINDDDFDTDRHLTFYEPVTRQGKSTGRTSRSQQTADAGTAKTKVIRMTSLLAETAGGQLDQVLEHSGIYYKIRLTLPANRLESFKRALAAQDHIATLSVTEAGSTAGDMTTVILEINSR